MLNHDRRGQIDQSALEMAYDFASKKENLPCNQPKRETHGDKKGVVKACGPGLPKDGKLIRFGDANSTTAGKPKKGESEKQKARRRSFKARHRRNIAKGPKSAAYWADKLFWSESSDFEEGCKEFFEHFCECTGIQDYTRVQRNLSRLRRQRRRERGLPEEKR